MLLTRVCSSLVALAGNLGASSNKEAKVIAEKQQEWALESSLDVSNNRGRKVRSRKQCQITGDRKVRARKQCRTTGGGKRALDNNVK